MAAHKRTLGFTRARGQDVIDFFFGPGFLEEFHRSLIVNVILNLKLS
jgi:hypothetical protein